MLFPPIEDTQYNFITQKRYFEECALKDPECHCDVVQEYLLSDGTRMKLRLHYKDDLNGLAERA